MVSNRCKMVVKEELKKRGLHHILVHLGEIDIVEELSPGQLEELQAGLLISGLELIDDKRTILIEKIKTVIIEMIHYTNESIKMNFSSFLSEKLDHNYSYLTSLFSEAQGITIEQFIILHKVERIKELIIYDEMNITEIAWKMNYSSVAHLSNQFKKITGLSPSHFKQLKDKNRKPLDEVGDINLTKRLYIKPANPDLTGGSTRYTLQVV
jgi:AraC-like DNA-binding protein